MGGDQAAQAVAGRYGPARFLPPRFPIRHVPDHYQIGIPIAVHITQSTLRFCAIDMLAQHRKTRFSEQRPGQRGLHGDLPGLQFPQQQLFGSRQLNPVHFDKGWMIGRTLWVGLGLGLVASGRGCPAK